jgi:hypothetical protein
MSVSFKVWNVKPLAGPTRQDAARFMNFRPSFSGCAAPRARIAHALQIDSIAVKIPHPRRRVLRRHSERAASESSRTDDWIRIAFAAAWHC